MCALRWKRPLWGLPFILLSVVSWGLHAKTKDAEPEQTYQSCSIIASELLTGTQFYQRGLSLSTLYSSLPDITEAGKKRLEILYNQIAENGLISTYSTINSRYARCAKEVYKEKGKPDKQALESLFYFCSGENKLRYEVILAFVAQVPFTEILKSTPAQRRKLVTYMKDLFDEGGALKLFDFSATELKRCLNQ